MTGHQPPPTSRVQILIWHPAEAGPWLYGISQTREDAERLVELAQKALPEHGFSIHPEVPEVPA
jgi:hypothetical protein